MASEIRVNKITHTAGVGTITTSADGVVIAGIVTANNFSGNVTGNVTGSGANLTSIPAGQLTGTIADARFPSTLPAVSAANLTSIPAANITGTFASVNASNLTNIPAGSLTGIVTAARLGGGTASNSTFLRGDGTFAEAGGGKIVQITEGIHNVQTTIQGATSVTGLAGTITPQKAGSKILVIANQQGQIRVDSDPSQVINFYLDRDVAGGGFNNIQFQMYLGGAFPNNRRSDRMTTITQLDTPSYSLGQAISYRMRAGTYTSNYGLRYIAQHQNANSPSRMTLLEVAQ
jgi:hypothetical protein|tara:strand:- start:951 stop:1817 length:867 start_codon:yes stop_codon:yes gene_type:complete